MDSNGFLRIPMDSYGFLRIPMDSYGFLWIPMNSQDFSHCGYNRALMELDTTGPLHSSSTANLMIL
jgi:hypothetical protein